MTLDRIILWRQWRWLRVALVLLLIGVFAGVYDAWRSPAVPAGKLESCMEPARVLARDTWDHFFETGPVVVAVRRSGFTILGVSDTQSDVHAGNEPKGLERPLFLLTGKVLEVVAGDSLVVELEGGVRADVRLYGISAPRQGQPYHSAALHALSRKVNGKTLGLNVISVEEQGRLVAIVVSDGRRINADLVCEGHAWWYRRAAPEAQDLRLCQERARNRKLGLWEGGDPVPPWEWRSRQSAAGTLIRRASDLQFL